ncbi:hypothetical protein ASPZODRAFT_139617 [Penicilliopsis zonata CBS 506.65]|uniref:AB hydrolase-1 domain-containing protein n=1 Tax=Penicilliopsis zonata CBS 506.65 TaxID=1073090 RepID=A0A1L9SSX6_9EURO|nr:hypothetical protein ASPZODRAFT_139617 [Penicilliopsis zonata CBS 506.65]OJJ50310.1 hypothetical protein ASPZODRAFT_139617 [Penicilliopsis zonata CBS 506.65]
MASHTIRHLKNGIRALAGGESGSRTVLISGWPETAESFSDMVDTIATKHRFLAVEPPALGESAFSTSGYDTASISKTMAEAVHDALPSQSGYHLVGHDIGAWISYAWAAQFPSRILSLTVLDAAVPGYAPAMTFPLPPAANVKLWQFSFAALPDLPEMLTRGRERELLTWFFDRKMHAPEKLPRSRLERYIDVYSRPGVLSQNFEYYRAVATSAEQNRAFAAQGKLKMPVLALGGQSAMGKMLHSCMQPLAEKLEGGELEDCGHFLMEEQPQILTERLMEFWSRTEKEQ